MDDFVDFAWKIDNLETVNGIIKSAKYHVKASYEELSVDTEGYCYLNGFGGVAFDDVTEQTVIDWIKEYYGDKDGCFIEQRLKEQLKSLQIQAENRLPWKPKTFKVSI